MGSATEAWSFCLASDGYVAVGQQLVFASPFPRCPKDAAEGTDEITLTFPWLPPNA